MVVVIRPQGAASPNIHHQDIAAAKIGIALPVRAKIETALPATRVRLHYRHLDQSEDWNIVEMRPANGQWEATIPADFIVPNWDLMYAIEAVDESGSGTFYPNLDLREPFIVVPVSR